LLPPGREYSVVVVVPERDGKDFAPYYALLDIAQDPFMGPRLPDSADHSVGRVFRPRADFGSELTLAKYC
jgi:hypothetical protein